MFELPSLPYAQDALVPFISKETIEYHYLKHHKTYVDNLNKLLENQVDYLNLSLEDIIQKSTGPLFNNAAQVWNHTFYWHCLSPEIDQEPSSELLSLINNSFGSFALFKEKFTDCALKTFGSGWAWLVLTPQGNLDIISTSNAQTPITMSLKPLLTCDVWEHAYYIDYRNARAQYMTSFWKIINWKFVQNNLSA